MKAVIIGATGVSGLELTKQILDKTGPTRTFQKVVLLIRNKSKIPESLMLMLDSNPAFEIVEGDVTDKAVQLKAIPGANVIFATIGYSSNSPTGYFSKTIETIAEIVNEQSMMPPVRLIVLTGASLVFGTEEKYTWSRKLMRNALNLLVGAQNIEDIIKVMQVVKTGIPGKLEGVSVRPPMLTNTERTEKYIHDKYLDLSMVSTVSRANLTHFMLQLALDDNLWEKYKGFAPMIVDQ